MQFKRSNLNGVFVFTPNLISDNRGYFFESFRKNLFIELGIEAEFVQENESCSEYGTIRGLHFQIGECSQAKLVRVVKGSVLDVIVDIRKGSETYGKTFSLELSSENKKQIFIPRGFAHGFSVLSKEAVFQYKCDNYYNKDSESGIHYLDSELNIDWRVPQSEVKISEKDLLLPQFVDVKSEVAFG